MDDCIATFCTTEKSVEMLKACNNNVKFFQCITHANPHKWVSRISSARITNYFTLSIFSAANIFALLLLIKLISQLRLQLRSKNRHSFISMLKIVAVITFQCFTMSLIFVISFIQFDLYAQAVPSTGIKLYNFAIYKQIPVWLYFLQYSATTTSLNILRVFLDSFVILTVLSGYSECVKKSLKILGHCLIQPKSTCEKIKRKLKLGKRYQTSIFVMSAAAAHNNCYFLYYLCKAIIAHMLIHFV